MMKKSKLLKVISILMIIFGAFGLIHDGLMIFSEPRNLGFLTSLLLFITCVVAGFFGILTNSKKGILILGLLLIPVVFIEALTSDVIDIISFIFMIWPILYLWGWYKSSNDIT